jgi:hypothetical protein
MKVAMRLCLVLGVVCYFVEITSIVLAPLGIKLPDYGVLGVIFFLGLAMILLLIHAVREGVFK